MFPQKLDERLEEGCFITRRDIGKRFIGHKTIQCSWHLIMTPSLSTRELREIAESIERFSKSNRTSSEPNTKKKIIEPLLETLGWDTRTGEVDLEYPIRMGTGTHNADYALVLENKPAVLVEAKAFDVELSYEHARQVISYGRVEGVQWGVLTNGRKLKIFDTEKGKTEKECLVIEIDLTKLPVQANDLNLVSRESILTGDIEAAAKRLAATRNALRNLQLKQKEIAEEFKTILLKITGKDAETRVENISKQLAKQTIELFERQVETVPGLTLRTEVQLITRNKLAMKPPGEVVFCPSRIEGVEFLKKYNAWGFVTIGRRQIPYFALYVGRPESSVLYFGEIESITQPLKSKEDLVKIQMQDTETFETGKRVIHLKRGTLVRFKDPIPLKNRRSAPRGLRYTTLEKLIQVECVSDL